MKIMVFAAACGLATAGAHAQPFDVTYESERPGLEATTATLSAGGVETFDNRTPGTGNSFTSSFGSNGVYGGRYSNIQINRADQYGGAGGHGRYAVSFARNGAYSLDFTTAAGHRGVDYFGYWLSALDAGNDVHFFSKGKELFTFRPQDVIDAVNSHPDRAAYYGNPDTPFVGQNRGEPYIFLNFFREKGSFDRIVFEEFNSGGGYESDNHTVGRFLTKGTGTPVPIVHSGPPTPTPTPEAGSLAMLGGGLAMTGAAVRGRRRS